MPIRVRHGFLYTEPTVAECLAELRRPRGGRPAAEPVLLAPDERQVPCGARRRRWREGPAAGGVVRRPRLREGHQQARRGGARRLRRQRVGGALHGPQRAARDDHGGRPLRRPVAADHRAARSRSGAGRLALRFSEQGPRRRRVARARGRRRGARPGRGGLEEGARRAGGLRQRQRRDALRPRHRAAAADRGAGHGVSPLVRAQRLAARSSRLSPTW